MSRERFADLAAAVRVVRPRLGETRLVAVDGPSGAGKSWFAERLGEMSGAPVVHTDDLLDGWDDQFTFWHRFEELVLRPLRAGRPGGYRRYDWHLGRFGGDVVSVEPAEMVIIEGVSAARAAIRPELSLAVFLSAPAELRVQRVLSRDGGHDVAFAAYFERWRRAEERHFAADETAAHADVLVDGAAGDEEQYERLWRQPVD